MALEARDAPATDRDRVTETHCPYCALQCGMSLVGSASTLEVAARDFPTNRGGLCRKGWTSAELLDSPDRLHRPMMRMSKGAPLLPATWEEAVTAIAARIREIQHTAGVDAMGVFGGGGLTNEKAYMLGK